MRDTWQFIRQAIYQLKRQYGTRVTVVKLNDAQTDYRTGRKTLNTTTHAVRRAIMLPEEIGRRVEQGAAYISANKNLLAQAGFDQGKAMFIFDADDLPSGFRFGLDDHILVGTDYHKVSKIKPFEPGLGWIIYTHHVDDATFGSTLTLAASNALSLAHQPSVTET